MVSAGHMPEVGSAAVENVRFSFMRDEEVRRHSVVKITNPTLLDSLDRPTPGGLYDPAMGPLDEHSRCRFCSRRSYYCPGHCGHIELVSTAYNPLMFNLLYNLLQKTCFNCFRFRSGRQEVKKCVSQLELIAKGHVIEARNLSDSTSKGKKSSPEDSSSDTDDNDPVNLIQPVDSGGSNVSYGSTSVNSSVEDKLEQIGEQLRDSFQIAEAISVLNKFLGAKPKNCMYCKDKNAAKITKPQFGWLRMEASAKSARAIAILRSKLERSKENSFAELANANGLSKDDKRTAETDSVISAASGVRYGGRKDPLDERIGVNLEFEKHKSSFSSDILPSEAKGILKLLWENESPLCSYICDLQREQLEVSHELYGYLMFFLDSVIVPPIKFRPPAKGGDAVMEHPHTVLLGKVLQSNSALGNAFVRNAGRSRIISCWRDLQQSINVLYDSKTMTGQSQKGGNLGIIQLLEKKEGIFRQKMMGKRVNFACRSVISPDPYLAVNEIGIPPYFALRLTYPERVTPWNAENLRNAVINGPEVHPGAVFYADKVSTMKLPSSEDASSKNNRKAKSRKLISSGGEIAQSIKNFEHGFEGKVIFRHLKDGDIVLVNRQPTLHKPSIMAHVVRVLKGEKTLRMHYANCSSYNADFDGDEMNVHFPQDEISRAEAYNIVNANEQYIIPTKGDTVRGLIQDHIVSAVLLTMKDRFLTLDEFNQLIYGSGIFAATSSSKASSDSMVPHVLPALWKPKPLWTGKQVITSLLNHITRGCPPCTVEKETKIPKQYFPSESYRDLLSKDEKISENVLLVWKNELVCGIIDKAQFGKFGLVHTVQELYGSNSAGLLLSALSRVFTMFLQLHGFTCGVDDLIILQHFDLQRKEELEGEDVGEEVHSEFVKFRRGQIGPKELQLEIEKVVSSNRESATAYLDMKMKNRLTKKAEKISKGLLREGLLKPFPKNCISLMTISGAKGSTVNFQQISSYLGQQELEGKRVPRMVSGKTLPCFSPWDFSSRAGGYITDRFLSGLRPQEYYFHCMAGREGLVDTAVKTSRSGYLQRCLIKNLESLKVCYDYTVRDADGSIVQFYYGEDGIDPHSTSFLTNFRALTLNQETVHKKFQFRQEFNAYVRRLPEVLKVKVKGFFEESIVDDRADFLEMLNQKYLSSLAPPGEPVGVIAAQSVGEPSTQMTLNTFHLAGRGEMNVTLGIPRLQEILMTASDVIRTPVLTCPFRDVMPKDKANSIVAKVKKITVADIIESIGVHLLPCDKRKRGRIYKLLIKYKCPEFVSSKNCEETLKDAFQTALEDAVENHVVLLSEISGIKNVSTSLPKESSTGEDTSETTVREEGTETNDDEDSDNEKTEDLDSDAQTRRQQRNDEMDYEDDGENEPDGEDFPSENRNGKDSTSTEEDEGPKNGEDERDVSEVQSQELELADTTSIDSDTKSTGKSKKRKTRIVESVVKEPNFECHFQFTDEPHMLLAQIAEKTAKKVYINGSGKISECKMVEYDANEKTVIWDERRSPVKKNKSLPYWGLKAAGVDFTAFWQMSEHLDVNRIYSNNIHAVLKTYGVEAARETIIREVKNVFGIYGVEVDYRHLSLIADYMTHTGGYRPMSRHGSIAESLSPLLKMSFETASKFIVEAASHGMSDNLETPSSRICLGLPVKIGTGSFDLMQKLDF